MARATRPVSRPTATAPGGGGGRRGPPARGAMRRRRRGDSSVSGSSKKPSSVSSSKVPTRTAATLARRVHGRAPHGTTAGRGRTLGRGRQLRSGMGEAAPALTGSGLVLGRYRPLRPLGSGGMGHVWLARDERTGLDVALKIVAREGKSGARAEREARAAAALRHERCQRILSLARDPSHVYIAYEYVPGRTLREAMRAGALDDRAAVEVAAQIADALAHAHTRGIVHRDVKPSNVLIAESEEIDVRLLDFGLAQMAEFDTLTALGDVPGTLAYISPERLQGLPATPAADVWAAGVVLWEALAGRHPFRAEDLGETSRRIQAGAPPLAAVRPDLPERLQRAVGRALALDPARRPTA